MCVWLIFISFLNAEIFLDVSVMLPHNKIKLINYIFPSIGFIMETCAAQIVIFERYVVMKMSNFLQKRPHPCILSSLSWYLNYLKYDITYVCCPCHNRKLHHRLELQLHSFLYLALYTSEWSASRPGLLTSRERALSTH